MTFFWLNEIIQERNQIELWFHVTSLLLDAIYIYIYIFKVDQLNLGGQVVQW